jgi:hypothetical protein
MSSESFELSVLTFCRNCFHFFTGACAGVLPKRAYFRDFDRHLRFEEGTLIAISCVEIIVH